MNDIEAILKATIQTKVVEAFNQTPEMIDKLVQAALSQEVNSYGSKPTYNDTKMPYMEWLVGNEIRKAVTDVVREYVATHKESITQHVAESIQKGEYGQSRAKAVTDIMSDEWRWSVDLKIQKDS